MWVNANELSSQYSSSVDIGGVWLETLIVSEDLGGGCGGHGGHEEGVSGTMLLDFLLEGVPVVSIGGQFLIPHVILEDTLAQWRAWE